MNNTDDFEKRLNSWCEANSYYVVEIDEDKILLKRKTGTSTFTAEREILNLIMKDEGY